MGSSSRRYASIISSIASFMYFLVIILRIPLFRVPCRAGICKSPLELTCSHLIASKLFIPEAVLKTLLYPGAIASFLFTNKSIPSYFNFLLSYQSVATENLAHFGSHDLQRLEVLIGSYLSVCGSFIGLIKPGRLSLFGTLLALWGLSREVISRKSDYNTFPQEAVYIYPTMSIALISAFLSIRKDIRKIHRSFIAPTIAKAKHV